MACLLGREVSLSYCVDEQLLDCLERGIAFSETLNNSGEDLLEGLRSWFTLSHILGAVLKNSLAGNNVLHIHVSTPCRELDRVEAVYHPIIPSCKESWLILCDNGCMGLKRLGIAKAALLFSVLGAEAVGG